MRKKFITFITLGMLSVTAATLGGVIEIGPGTVTMAVDKPFCGG